jgi:hypothetical protein
LFSVFVTVVGDTVVVVVVVVVTSERQNRLLSVHASFSGRYLALISGRRYNILTEFFVVFLRPSRKMVRMERGQEHFVTTNSIVPMYWSELERGQRKCSVM